MVQNIKRFEMTDHNLKEMTDHALAAILFATNDEQEEGEYLDGRFEIWDFDPNAVTLVRGLCREFIQKSEHVLAEIEGNVPPFANLGHSLMMEVLRTGVGFRGSGMTDPETEKLLSDICEQFSEPTIEVSDAGKIHIR